MPKLRNPLKFGKTAYYAIAMTCMVAAATGCARAPSFNILGSYFPSWMLCGLIGILLTVAVRLAFLRVGLEQQLWPLIVIYPCLSAFFTFTLWLVFFS